MNKPSPYWPLIIALAVFKFFLPFILQSPAYELHRDEYLYYQQGQHLALGYLENPPLIAYLGRLTSGLPYPDLWIKFWPSLFGGLTVVLTCLLAVEFGGKKYAQFLAGLTISLGAFIRVHSLFQPNMLDIFSWTLAIYFIVRYINSSNTRDLWWFCLSLVIGFWSKYSIVFVGAALVVSLLLTKHRQIFARKSLYGAAFVAFLLILPNILWQYAHKFPLVHHMEELQETQLQFLNPLDFIKDQVLYFLPALVVWICGLVWSFRHPQWRFLFFSYFLVILLLLAGRGKSYYSLGIYPVLFAAGAASLERFSANRVWIRYALPAIFAGITIPFINVMLPVSSPEVLARSYQKQGTEKLGVLKWEDQRNHLLPQDFADMLGWEELTRKAETYYSLLPDSMRNHTVVYCRTYGQAGALKYFARRQEFRGKIFSDNGSFLLWIPDTLRFRHLLFVGRRVPGKDDLVFQHFQSALLIDSVSNIYSRQLGDKIVFFRDADDSAAVIAQNILDRKRSLFTR
jgi:hypothetical protein